MIRHPEKQLATWTAIRYSADHILDYVELDVNHAIFEIQIPADWVGKTIGQLDIRNNHNINIMAFKHDGVMNLGIKSDTRIPEGDTMLVLDRSGIYKSVFIYKADGILSDAGVSLWRIYFYFLQQQYSLDLGIF